MLLSNVSPVLFQKPLPFPSAQYTAPPSPSSAVFPRNSDSELSVSLETELTTLTAPPFRVATLDDSNVPSSRVTLWHRSHAIAPPEAPLPTAALPMNVVEAFATSAEDTPRCTAPPWAPAPAAAVFSANMVFSSTMVQSVASIAPPLPSDTERFTVVPAPR